MKCQYNRTGGGGTPEIRGENFHVWLSNREIHESFLPQTFLLYDISVYYNGARENVEATPSLLKTTPTFRSRNLAHHANGPVFDRDFC